MSGDESSEAVRAAAEARSRHARLSTQLETARALAATRRAELAALDEQLRVEERDVARIEGISPSRLWAILRGDAEERAARERAERDAAARAVAGARTRLEQAESEAARVEAERGVLGDVERAYAEALAAHERLLRVRGSGEAAELGTIAAAVGEVTDERREIAEARAALSSANEALADAFAALDSAGGWSTYDTFFGGGFVGDMMKHGRIDEASAAFARVNRALEHLAIELADVGIAPVEGVVVSGSLAVFDVLFDNILSDWMVRDRIARAREEARELHLGLSRLDLALAERDLGAATRLAELARRREQLLLAAG
ncbi:MAG: hypothetical protein DI566_06770 [Microbacterium sp.]|nr:MAG: hypothetical protein DI566_06770 [Microbacterium sp.]